MKRKITYLVAGILLSLTSVQAQSSSCLDTNKFVNYKNVGGTGYYTLTSGFQEKAAQTYMYSGPGRVSSIKLYGHYPGPGGVALRVGIYNVDATGRPTSLIRSTNTTWWWYNNFNGYEDVYFGRGGVSVSGNFAVEVELQPFYPFGTSFQVRYTGDGEGKKEDLASLAGTSTGNNWTSAMTNFSKDGDFYLVPVMRNFITSDFSSSEACASVSDVISFTNMTKMSTDSMFNTIAFPWYSGSNHFYEWDFGDGSPKSYAANPTHSYTSAGAYTVSLKSTLAGWTNTCSDVKEMRISVGLGASATSIVEVTCNGLSNGSAVAVGSAGISPFTYSLNGDSYQSGANFTGLAAGNYTLYVKDSIGCVATVNFNITQPTPIVFTSVATTNASCGNADGGILVSASGGAGSIQYQLNTNPFQASGAFTSLAAGAFTVTAKDANGCTAVQEIAVNDAGGPALTVVSKTDVSCNNGNDGTIVLNGTGGSGVLKYSIDGGKTYHTSGSFSSLPAGTYSAIVKDASGCSQVMELVISQPPVLVLTAEAASVSCNGGNNGQINVTSAIGGTGSFSYSVNGTVYQSSTSFPNLIAGTYTVYVKDAAGCVGTTTATVLQPTAVFASVTPTNATCNGSYDGSISITASGGVGSYSYSITSGDNQSTSDFSELSAGTYTVAVTDGNGCSYTTTTTVGQPTVITATLSTTSSTCTNKNGGILAVAAGGSGAGYQYSIDGTTFVTPGSFSNLYAGTYYVIVRDGAGCENIFPVTISDANGPVITSSSHTNVACNGGEDGSITINTVTGGTGTLQYSINGTNWQTSSAFTGLNAGIYTVTVKDANGCTGTEVDTLTQPNAFVISSTVANISCFGDNTGSSAIYASGGAGTFAYSDDGGFTFQSSNIFSNLIAGNYTVIVRDAAGCTGTSTFTVTQAPKLNLTGSVLNVSCHGAKNGSVALSATGGTGAFQYSLNGTTFQSSGLFFGLSGGPYTGYVKDANGCVITVPIIVAEPPALSITTTAGDVSCSGGNNGFVSLTVNGGTSPYDYNWSNDATSQGIFNLTAGSYFVTITDDNGCTDTATYTLTQPATPIVVNGVVNDDSTGTSTNGGVNLSTTGGVGPYSFSWSNGETTQNLTNVSIGTYTVTVTDANGCKSTMAFVVSVSTGVASLDAITNQVNMYPNPTNDIATVDAQGNFITSIKVIDILGQVLFQSEPKQTKAEINCRGLANGVYLVQIQVNRNLVTKRLRVIR